MLQKAKRDSTQATGHTDLARALMAYQPEESQIISKQGKFGYISNTYEL
jgi:hypothetical protein